MKPLHTLTGSAKARLLHELFPGEIKGFIKYLREYSSHFCGHAEHYREQWKNGFLSFDYWLSLSGETTRLLERYEHDMTRNSKVFAEQLYFGYTGLFVTDCIVKYAERVSTDEKFKLTVLAFFT